MCLTAVISLYSQNHFFFERESSNSLTVKKHAIYAFHHKLSHCKPKFKAANSVNTFYVLLPWFLHYIFQANSAASLKQNAISDISTHVSKLKTPWKSKSLVKRTVSSVSIKTSKQKPIKRQTYCDFKEYFRKNCITHA